ncbi:MAG: UDP-N-acetylmuramoyl-tripeptide--D-alanyl-D-alanine ligase, partial [Acetobacteraceae bacterium]
NLPGQPQLLVDDTLAGLTRLGAFARARFGGRLVAITGSVGKTTTKEMLRTILDEQAPTHAAVASYNNQWGVPLTLARLPADARFCVAEIGMNHAGEIEPLARLARPHVAVITTIEKAHIGYLGSIEAIADEKASILRGLETGGVAVLPADSPHLSRLRAQAGSARVLTFGASEEADVRLLSFAGDANGGEADVDFAGVALRPRIAAPGRHMMMNALAALTAAASLGVAPEAATRALERFSPMVGRGARRCLELPDGSATLLDESYNGNGASMRAALEVLRLLPARRHVAALGDMLELGEAGPTEHASLADDAASAADLVFVCGPLMRALYDRLPANKRGGCAVDSAELAAMLPAAIRPGDAILVKGSLGTRMKLVVSALDNLVGAA